MAGRQELVSDTLKCMNHLMQLFARENFTEIFFTVTIDGVAKVMEKFRLAKHFTIMHWDSSQITMSHLDKYS